MNTLDKVTVGGGILVLACGYALVVGSNRDNFDTVKTLMQ